MVEIDGCLGFWFCAKYDWFLGSEAKWTFFWLFGVWLFSRKHVFRVWPRLPQWSQKGGRWFELYCCGFFPLLHCLAVCPLYPQSWHDIWLLELLPMPFAMVALNFKQSTILCPLMPQYWHDSFLGEWSWYWVGCVLAMWFCGAAFGVVGFLNVFWKLWHWIRACRTNAIPKICILNLIFRKENAEFCSLYFDCYIIWGLVSLHRNSR